MDEIERTNCEAYRNDLAVEQYSSHYYLYPVELYLFRKYYQPGDSILDLACGGGRTTVRLHEMQYKVKGLDRSDVLIEIASKRFPYLSFTAGSYCKIPEGLESYDHVLISHNGLDYSYPEANRLKAVSEAWRVLKRGGTFIFSSHNINSLWLSPLYLRNPMKAIWMFRNMPKALKRKCYIRELGMWTFFASPSFVVEQVVRQGFELVEQVGYMRSSGRVFWLGVSPFVHYVFRKR